MSSVGDAVLLLGDLLKLSFADLILFDYSIIIVALLLIGSEDPFLLLLLLLLAEAAVLDGMTDFLADHLVLVLEFDLDQVVSVQFLNYHLCV
jgi:hypothetical protein